MRILFIASSRLAEAVIASGVLEQLRVTYPKARITVACGSASSGYFSRLPRLERQIRVGRGKSDEFHYIRLWARLVVRFWDIVVDARGSGLPRFLLAGQRHIIHLRKGRQRYQQMGDAMGFVPAPAPVAWMAPADLQEAERRLPPGPPIIGLGPTAAIEEKAWPGARYVETARSLAGILPDARFALFCAAADAERRAAAQIQAEIPEALLLPGTLSLPVMAACMARLSLYIGNDTGLMQLAAAAGAPTLGLFGHSRAAEYAPAGPHCAALSAPTVDGISVERVLATATALLRQN